MGKRRRAFFRYIDTHSVPEAFGNGARRLGRFFVRLFTVPARFLGDPFKLSLVTGAVLVVGGLALIGLAWRGAAEQINVALQIAYLTSGGLAGLAVVLFGVGILHIQGSRKLAAQEKARMESVTGQAALLLEAASLARRRKKW